MTIDFDPDRHEYRVDGKLVPSVTQLCAPLGADYDEPDELTELAIDAAAERGTILHEYIAHRLRGGEPEDFELPGQYQPYADAVELFLSEHGITPYAIETPLGGEDFAGTPDLTCEFDGEDAILDWKFVSQIAKSKVGAQLGGYRELCLVNGALFSRLCAVQFLRDGEYRIYPVSTGFADRAFDVCRNVQQFKNYRHPRGQIG